MSINTTASSRTVDSVVPVPLLLPGARPIMSSATFAPAQSLPPGAVCGIATSGPNAGMAVLSVATATDGSQVPSLIAALPILTYLDDGSTPQAKNYPTYVSGSFNSSALYFDASFTLTQIRLALLDMGILTPSTPGYSG